VAPTCADAIELTVFTGINHGYQEGSLIVLSFLGTPTLDKIKTYLPRSIGSAPPSARGISVYTSVHVLELLLMVMYPPVLRAVHVHREGARALLHSTQGASQKQSRVYVMVRYDLQVFPALGKFGYLR
jgi:hypothetical protein